MNKKIFLLFGIFVLLGVLGVFLFTNKQKIPLSNPISNLTNAPKEIKPSETFIEYQDPAGFSFSYPDNLSISKTEIEDPNTYADLQIFSKDVNGSLTLKITDSKFTSIDEWLKTNNISTSSAAVEKKLGNLNALEIKSTDRLTLVSLDQKILFTVEMPLLENDFWTKVYNKLLTDFTFETPVADNSQTTSSSDEVTFEGEEVVE